LSNKVSVLVYKKAVGSPVRKSILAYLADKASDDGSGIWASKQTIADETECGRSTVIKTINDFVEEGLLAEAGKRPCASGATVVYSIILNRLLELPDAKGHNRPSRPARGPVQQRDPSSSGTQAVQQRDPKPSSSGTQTIHEPPLTSSSRDAGHDAFDFLSAILSAVGIKSGRMPTRWMPPAATLHVNKWKTDLGLTEAEVIDAARESRKRFSDPPDGPKALDRVMQNLSAAKQAPALAPTQSGAKNDFSQSSRAINEFADRLSDGSISIDYSNRDPFAVR
jgi:hypothetical protein